MKQPAPPRIAFARIRKCVLINLVNPQHPRAACRPAFGCRDNWGTTLSSFHEMSKGVAGGCNRPWFVRRVQPGQKLPLMLGLLGVGPRVAQLTARSLVGPSNVLESQVEAPMVILLQLLLLPRGGGGGGSGG